MMASPVVTRVSQATRATGSCARIDSSTPTSGSLAEIEIDVFDSDGKTLLTSSDTDNLPLGDYHYAKFPNDPSVVDFQLPDAETGPIYIQIKNTNASEGAGAYYWGDVDITQDPLYK